MFSTVLDCPSAIPSRWPIFPHPLPEVFFLCILAQGTTFGSPETSPSTCCSLSSSGSYFQYLEAQLRHLSRRSVTPSFSRLRFFDPFSMSGTVFRSWPYLPENLLQQDLHCYKAAFLPSFFSADSPFFLSFCGSSGNLTFFLEPFRDGSWCPQ